MDGNGTQHSVASVIKRQEKRRYRGLEVRHFGRPDVSWHDFSEPMSGRQVTPDMPELLEIGAERALGSLDAEIRHATLATTAKNDIGGFYILGQREKGASRRQCAINNLLRNAMVRHHGETGASKGIAKSRRRRDRIMVDKTEGNRLYVGKAHS